MRLGFLTSAVVAGVFASGLAAAAPIVVKVEDMEFTTDSNLIETARPGFGSAGPVTLDWGAAVSPFQRLLNWNGLDYSRRREAWCTAVADCRLDLTVAPGSTVTLESFFLGAWLNHRIVASFGA